MGGCAAAQAAGWAALCQVTQVTWQVQVWANRVAGAAQAIAALGPLQAAFVLLLAMVVLAVAWQVVLWLCQVLFQIYPYVLAAGVLLLLFAH